MKLRICALSLAALLTLGLVGCAAAPSAEPSAEPAPTAAAEDDVILRLAGVPADTVLLTVDGAPVTAEVYLYWLGYTTSYYDSYVQYEGGEMDWGVDDEGVSLAEYLKSDAVDTALLYSLIFSKAEELGCGLTAQQADSLTDSRQSVVDSLGGEEAYARQIRRAAISDDALRTINSATFLYENLREALFGVTPVPTAEEIAAYIAENDLLRAKHILLLTIDMNTFAALSDEEIAEKRAQAEDIVARLAESADPAADFDALMFQYSEDTGLATYPDGYVFSSGEMVDSFEDTVRELDLNAVSGIVESEYGFHIILRLDPDCEETRTRMSEAETQAITDQFDAQIDEWVTQSVVEYTPEYDTIDPQRFYENLVAFRAEIDSTESEDSAP